MSNAIRWAATIRDHDRVYTPYRQARTAPIDPADIAAVAVAALTQPGHQGHVYPLTGPEVLDVTGQVNRLAAALGRPLAVIDVLPEAARQAMIDSGVPAPVVDSLMATMADSASRDPPEILPTVAQITGQHRASEHPPARA
jgi:uncharacterized protein YbjT (DUF2867 family)